MKDEPVSNVAHNTMVWNRNGDFQVCEKWLKDRQAKGGKNPRP